MSSLVFTATTMDGPGDPGALDSRVVEFLGGAGDPVRLREVTAAAFGPGRAGKNPESTRAYACLARLAERGLVERVVDDGGVYGKYRLTPAGRGECPTYEPEVRRGPEPTTINAVLRFLHGNPGRHTATGVARGVFPGKRVEGVLPRVFRSLATLGRHGYVDRHGSGQGSTYELAPPSSWGVKRDEEAGAGRPRSRTSDPDLMAKAREIARLVRRQQRALEDLAERLESIAGRAS